MPTYQYRCTECGHDLEAVQKFTDAALTECPNCSGQLRKVYNAVGVVFKGSGFYRTDSRKAPGESGSAEVGASATTASGDTAPAGRTDGAATPAKESSGSGSSSSPAKGSSTATKPAKAAGS